MKIKHIKNKKIVLDSCIFIYSCDKETEQSCLRLLDKILSNNHIAYSAISGFEVLKNRQEKNNHKKYTDFLNKIHRIPVDSPVLMNAAVLFYVYKKSLGKIGSVCKTKTGLLDPKNKLTGDLIIGGTVISYENHLLLTANRKDFPEKYWKSVTESEVISNGEEMIEVFLLEPVMNEILKNIDSELQDPRDWPTRESIYQYRG